MSTSKDRNRRGIAAAMGLLLGIGAAAVIAPKSARPVLNAIVTLAAAVACTVGTEKLIRPKRDPSDIR